MPPEQEVDPSKPSEAQKRQLPAVELCRDVAAGTTRMREKKATYLPQFPKEEEPDYLRRVRMSTLFNAFARSVEGFVGMVFGEDPELGEDVPAEIVGDRDEGNEGGHWEDIDNAGTHGDVFLADRLSDALTDGHVGIFVDMPPSDPTVQNEKDVADKGIRPYWVPIKKGDFLRWRVERIGGRQVLTRFAFKEEITEPDGQFGEKCIPQVRDYVLVDGKVVFTKWQKRQDEATKKETWGVVAGTPAPMDIDEIPLAVAYAKKCAPLESKPPLEDLAHVNVKHFQIESDFDNTLHLCGVPFLHFAGFGDLGKVKISSNAGIEGPQDSSVEYVEPSGNALEPTAKRLDKLETEMAVLGLAMLKPETRAAETAEAKRLDKAATDSALAKTARSLQDAAEQALGFHAKWMRKDEDGGGSLTVSRDFDALTLTTEEMSAFSALEEKGQLSIETLWQVLRRGKRLPDGFDPKAEKDRLDQEAMKNPPLALPLTGRRPLGAPQPPAPPVPDPKPDPDIDPNVRK